MALPETIQRGYHHAVLDAHAAHLRGQGLTYRQIATEMGCSVRTAYDRVQRAYGRMPGPEAAAERQRMVRELDELAVACYSVMETAHVTVTSRGVAMIDVWDNGRVVGQIPVPDDHPVLDAVDRLLKIQERRAKLLGTDAPSKRSVEVVTKDALVAEMERMTQEMAADGSDGPG